MLLPKNSIFFICIILATSIISLSSCKPSSNTSYAEETLEEAGEDFADLFRSEQEELTADLRDLKDDLASRAAEIERSIENDSDDSGKNLYEKRSELEKYEKKVDQAIYDAEHAVEENWEKTKSDINQVISDINQEFTGI